MEETIGLFAVISPFITAVIILLIIFITKYLRDKSRNEVVAKALEMGKELPVEFFATPESKKNEDPLRSALISIGVGIGLFIALYFFFDNFKFAAFGCIPLFIGIGQLIAYFINKNKEIKGE